ncbi:hypothetical protein LIER_43740 [Lithospermum erythrorhizon]|uniref:Uncharacterized protein n=1 Tax=Lithospermum erythrorhizon TaxID=34254 RepID=A0AAV3QSG7_LITER
MNQVSVGSWQNGEKPNSKNAQRSNFLTDCEKPKLKIAQRSKFSTDLASGYEENKLKNAQRFNFSTDLASGCEENKLKNAQKSNFYAQLASGCEENKLENAQRSNFYADLASGREENKLENAQKSNFYADLASGCEKSEVKLRCMKLEEVSVDSFNLKEMDNCLNVNVENLTPVNKSFGGSSLNSANFEDSNANSSSKVKTPPIEASVSPEIQFGASVLLVSEATPNVCYGTGHILSGVSDRRKCRSRGILTVGGVVDYRLGSGKDWNKTDCDYSCDGKEDDKVKESGSLILLPAEASVKWLLSPCDENSGSPKGESSRKLKNLGDIEGSSPSVSIGSDSDLVWDSSERVRDMSNDSGKTYMVSPIGFSKFEGFTGNFSEKIDEDFLSNGMVEQDKKGFYRNIIEENSPLSIGSLSSGNVIQTPNSDYRSGESKGRCWLKTIEHGTGALKPELDTEARICGEARSILDPLDSSFRFTDLSSSSCAVDLNPLRKNFDNHVSSVSVSSVDNMSQSHIRISWRDTLASRSSDVDELDCCRCLSDEDIGVDELQKFGNDCSSRRENGKSTGSTCRSPECIEQEIDFPFRKKEKVFPYKPKSCAESISTDGGGLAASEDFD